MNGPTTSFLALFGRLLWMMVGPMFLVFLTIAIVQNGNGWFTPADFAYLAVLAAMLLGRLVEYWEGNPQTASGEPATRAQVFRYLAAAGGIGAGVWILANLLANEWIGS